MVLETTEEAHKARVLDLANVGMESGAGGDYEAARQAWLDALDYAERYLPGNNIIPWIRSGLGDALLQIGDYRGALEMAGSALDYCVSVRAPAASITMAKAYLRLGDMTRARELARQACDLKGEKISQVFTPADRQALGLAAPP